MVGRRTTSRESRFSITCGDLQFSRSAASLDTGLANEDTRNKADFRAPFLGRRPYSVLNGTLI